MDGSIPTAGTPASRSQRPPNTEGSEGDTPPIVRFAVCGGILAVTYVAARAITSVVTTVSAVACYGVTYTAGFLFIYHISSSKQALKTTHAVIKRQIENITKVICSFPFFSGFAGGEEGR
jgi:hypothetical protein